ncbi:putative salicylate hydroxylase [Cadophora sp. MPI-SDFR-AT-0126]|nr:putative salicylate hydroxylase [Leotiomycetes sp. MPI-SDFR-AT-0126]
MGSSIASEQLNVIIVGAGIAGLTAATALKHAGHKVTILESSKLLQEVGAAITLSPNGTRVLAKLGFDFAAARGVRMDSVAVYAGDTLENQDVYPPGAMDEIEANLGFPYRAFHRVDLHNELKKLALKDDDKGPKVDLHLGVKAMRVDVEIAEVESEEGTVRRGDLLIGADGLHSFVRNTALGRELGQEESSEDVGWNIYRWLLDSKDVEADLELRPLMRKARSTFVLPHGDKTLRLVWYACRDGKVQNLAAFCPATEGTSEGEDYSQSASKDLILELFAAYHPTVLRLVKKADTIKTWRLRNRTPLKSYIYGKTILIGDAAHPMLPFNAQAGNQALEDAGALLALFSDLPSKSDVGNRMMMFDAVRRKRASRQQIISSVPAEHVKNLGAKLDGYEEEGTPEDPRKEGMRERLLRELGYNVLERCQQVLAESLPSQMTPVSL